MLGSPLRTSVPDQVWSSLSVTTPEQNDAGDLSGPPGTPPKTVSRSHARTVLEGRAIVYLNKQPIGVVMKDISYKGVGFISPQQIFPQERLIIVLHKEVRLVGVLRRCRRLGDKRYMCGIEFFPEPLSTPRFREIQRLLEE